MKILVINSGSSSIKYKCFEMPEGQVLASGLCEKIGEPTGRLTRHVGDRDTVTEREFPDHSAALEAVLAGLTGEGGGGQGQAEEQGGKQLVHGESPVG